MLDEKYSVERLMELDSHERKVEERADFIGCGVMGVGTNETNTYRRTGRKNTTFWSAIQ